ncbi:MAG: OmpH family outer membrane protein [Bacteroidales bacterium]|nr:OmpH family outer membrane protein [Bacteroidales bacterium]
MKKNFIVVLLLIVGTISLSAQKIAYVHRDSVLLSMPEMIDAQNQLNAFISQVQTELQTMQNDYQTKVTAFNNNVDSLSTVVKNNKVAEIQDLERRIQDFQVQAQTEYLEKQKQLLVPIQNKFDDALEKVRKAGGYDVIMNVSADVLYVNPKFVITDEVFTELNIQN